MDAAILFDRIVAVMRQSLPADVSVAYFDAWVVRSRERMVATLGRLLGSGERPDIPELWSPARRTAANLAAMTLLARRSPGALSDADLRVLLGYSGWGGLSIEEAAGKFPPGVPVPDPAGLIHEFYTPSRVCRAVAAAVQPWLGSLVRGGEILALEPSAGIGRFIHAFTGAGFEAIRWHAAEMSPLSAAILRAARPDVALYEGPFEGWVAGHAHAVDGKLGLVVSNPPYGIRGPSAMQDPDKATRDEKVAYAYFMRRALGLLRPDGVGVFLVPSGFLTGQGARSQRLRSSILLRHHLTAAFRLPSKLFPGAMLVTDLLFFRARAGSLSEVDAADTDIAAGRYFEQFPGHILGREVGKPGDDEDQTVAPRWGYQVIGEFEGLPPFEERPSCSACSVVAEAERLVGPSRPRTGVERRITADLTGLPTDAQIAAGLGVRVDEYLSMVARGDPRVADAWPELRAALAAWVASYGNPHEHRLIVERARDVAAFSRFLAGFAADGGLSAALAKPVRVERAWLGKPEDVLGQAAYLYRASGVVLLTDLARFHHDAGGELSEAAIELRLREASGWVEDGGWYPLERYLEGDLWPRYDRQAARARGGDARAQALLPVLLRAIGPITYEEIDDVAPNYGWIPHSLLEGWISERLNRGRPITLVRRDGLVVVEGVAYEDMAEDSSVTPGVTQVVGWLNHDRSTFKPPKKMRVEGADGDATADEKRIALAKIFGQDFRAWIAAGSTRRTELANAYNRTFRGWVRPAENPEPFTLGRWASSGPSPRPVQWAGANRVAATRGGMVAFDVGVGKTITGLLILARARQEGWAKRPVLLVPNNIVWKWANDIRRCLPDYTVGVIGSKQRWAEAPLARWRVRLASDEALAELRRSRPRARRAAAAMALLTTTWASIGDLPDHDFDAAGWRELAEAKLVEIVAPPGRWVSITDTPEERAEKWTRFQAGLFDVMLVTYTAFTRTQMNTDAVLEYVKHHEGIQREIALQRRNAAGAGKLTERQRAILRDGAAAWVAEQMELPESWSYDPGIAWDDLGVDLLIVDEAQNYKNLNMPEPREGGVPRFMGNAGEGAKRAWQMDFRCASVRRRAGGRGVVLLSATPAKNSPLEFYNLIQYVSPDVWLKAGIRNSEQFIDRFLLIEQRAVVGSDLQVQVRPAVVGFKNLDELRDIVFGLADFRTAKDAGIVLPEPKVQLVTVPMNAAQTEKYDGYIQQIEAAIENPNPAAKTAILGLLARMAMVAIHPDLDGGYGWKDAPTGADFDVTSPKFDACAEAVLAQRTCGHIIFVDNVAAHRWMRETLIRAGIPEARIAVLNGDAADTAARFAIAQAFNGDPEAGVDPAYDVVIANQVAYEGIDLQTRTCAIHHLDLPWEPATLEQRNGRGVRQGNTLSTIEVRYYFAERSLDGLRFNLIQGKRGWMTALIASQDRSTNNPGAQSDMGPDEVLLLISRDPEKTRERLEKMKAKVRAEALEKEARAAARSLSSAQARFRQAERLIATATTPEERAEAETARLGAEERLADALTASPEAWPWHRAAPVVRVAHTYVNSSNAPWEVVSHGSRWRVPSAAGDPVWIEAYTEGGVLRRPWGKLDFLPGTAGWRAEPSQYDPEDWPENEAAAVVHYIRTQHGTWDAAHAQVGAGFWDRWWPQIGFVLIERSTSTGGWGYRPMPWSIPWAVVDRAGALVLDPVYSRMLEGHEIIPPTTEGWHGFLAAAAATPRVTHRAVDAIAQRIWGRRFPFGVLPGSTAKEQQP